MPVQYGYTGPAYKPPVAGKVKTGGLAAAASSPTASDPFGFQASRNTTGYRDATPPAAAPVPAAHVSAATSPLTAAATKPVVNPTTLTPSAAPTPGGYDINTDPTLQSITALTGLSDEQANAEALKQKQHQLLAYGDPGLAAAALGSNDPTVQAAGQNPTSTLSQLGHQRDQNLKSLTDQLFQSNLGYSGYRVTQEEQAAQDYQNQLANAAAGVNGNLDTISGNLSSTLAGNQQQRITAEQAARDRAVQAALAGGGAGGTGGAGTGVGGDTSGQSGADIPLGGDTGLVNPQMISTLAAAASQTPGQVAAVQNSPGYDPWSNLLKPKPPVFGYNGPH